MLFVGSLGYLMLDKFMTSTFFFCLRIEEGKDKGIKGDNFGR